MMSRSAKRSTALPRPTLTIGGSGSLAHSSAATITRTTSSTYTKSRVCSPVPKISTGAPRNTFFPKRLITPAYGLDGF